MIEKSKRIVVFSFFDYSVFKKEENTVKEVFLTNSPIKFHSFSQDFKNIEEEIREIKNYAVKYTIADVVMVVCYEIYMELEQYNSLNNMLNILSETELNLSIFKQNLYNENAIRVLKVFPIIVENRINKTGIYS